MMCWNGRMNWGPIPLQQEKKDALPNLKGKLLS
jgi:hypothetical protein